MLAMEEDCLRALRDVLGKTMLRRVDKSEQVHPERELIIGQSVDQVCQKYWPAEPSDTVGRARRRFGARLHV
jgi:hypothetical protein